jgi:FkbM family methyltransferase
MPPIASEYAATLLASLESILREGSPVALGAGVPAADAFFVYRLLLGRNPGTREEYEAIVSSRATYRDYLTAVLRSDEFARTGGFLPAGRTLMAETEGFRFWFDSGDREMGVRMAFGLYEPRTVAALRSILRPGMRCVDVGAQSGFYTCLMASRVGPGGFVHAFEPMPANGRMVTRNVEENRFGDRVRLHPLAASDRDSEVEGSLLSNMFVGGRVEGAEPFRMTCARVDGLVDWPVDLVKIDVEGFEPPALRGMERLISRSMPVLISECNEYWLNTLWGSGSDDYVNQLRGYGYDVYRLDDRLEPVGPGPLGLGPLETADVLAVPKGRPVPVIQGC